MISIPLTLLIGVIAGILSGLLGVGGGLILVPAMVFFFGTSQHLAQGISLLVIIPTAISGVWQLHKSKMVDYRIAGYLSIGAVIGALCSSNIAQFIPSADLKRIFGAFIIYMGFRMVMPKNNSVKK